MNKIIRCGKCRSAIGTQNSETRRISYCPCCRPCPRCGEDFVDPMMVNIGDEVYAIHGADAGPVRGAGE